MLLVTLMNTPITFSCLHQNDLSDGTYVAKRYLGNVYADLTIMAFSKQKSIN